MEGASNDAPFYYSLFSKKSLSCLLPEKPPFPFHLFEPEWITLCLCYSYCWFILDMQMRPGTVP
jgi:hypothetical protein